MLDLRGDGAPTLKQDNIESTLSTSEMVPGQILGGQLDQLFLLPLMDGMDGSAKCIVPTRLYLNKHQHLPVFSH
jgi:hypothetical protein